MKCKILFILFFLLTGLSAAYAQKMQVTGTVIDNEGYEVIGGSVTIKGAAGHISIFVCRNDLARSKSQRTKKHQCYFKGRCRNAG